MTIPNHAIRAIVTLICSGLFAVGVNAIHGIGAEKNLTVMSFDYQDGRMVELRK